MRSNEQITRSILIVEDEPVVAFNFRDILREAGWAVKGPVATVEEALAILEGPDIIDVALLDVLLHDQKATPIADALDARNIPFALISGIMRTELGRSLVKRPWLPKPVSAQKLLTIARELAERPPSPQRQRSNEERTE